MEEDGREAGWDERRRDGIGRGGMRSSGVGWDGVGRVRTGWKEMQVLRDIKLCRVGWKRVGWSGMG